MEVNLTSTDKIVELNGAPARVWQGVTKNGTECVAVISRIVCRAGQEEEFQKELQEKPAPANAMAQQAIPMKFLID